jgi:hypothetical protein
VTPLLQPARSRTVRWLIAAVGTLLLALVGLITPIRAADGPIATEYQLKGGFLMNFARFTRWPSNAFTATNSPFIVGLVDPGPAADAVQEVLKNRQVEDHPVEVRRFTEASDRLRECHLVFVSSAASELQGQILKLIANQPILTVIEGDEGASIRPMLRFLIVDQRVRFRLDLAAARDAGLQPSAKLAQLSVK